MKANEAEVSSMVVVGLDHPQAKSLQLKIDALSKRFPDVPADIAFGHRDGDSLIVSRGLFSGIRPQVDSRVDGVQLDVGFNFDLLDDRASYQEPMLDEAISRDEGVIVGPTGSGKTIIMSMLLARVSRRALVMVHSHAIADQLRLAIKKFLGVEPGFIGGGIREVKPITVGLMQSIRSLDPILNEIGLLVIDEAHHVSANSYLKILANCPAKRRYGLTATINKSDAKEQVIFAALGPVISKVSVKELQAKDFLNKGSVYPVYTQAVGTYYDYVASRCWYFKSDPPKCPKESPCTYPEDESIANCVYAMGYLGWVYGKLSKDEVRNDRVVQSAAECSKSHPWTVLLTHRKNHAEYLHERLKSSGVKSILAIGSPEMKKKERALNLQKYRDEGGVLVATSQMIGEGFDAPKTSCLVRAMPSGGKVAVRQQTGRIMRRQEKDSIIVDFVDSRIERLDRMWMGRRSIYRSLGFEVAHKSKKASQLDLF